MSMCPTSSTRRADFFGFISWLVIPSRADGEGPHSRSLRHTKKHHTRSDEDAVCFAQALDHWRGPSARFASLGMTSCFDAYQWSFRVEPFHVIGHTGLERVFRFVAETVADAGQIRLRKILVMRVRVLDVIR